MGCANSKQSKCRHCRNGAFTPVPRSYSMHVHHPSQGRGDSYHMVALTSSTYGSLKLDSSFSIQHIVNNNDKGVDGDDDGDDREVSNKPVNFKDELSVGVIEAKTWSNMINEKIPKVMPRTPTRTPPGEPETINAWEMMEGLEDTSPLRPNNHARSFSFDVVREKIPLPLDRPKSRFQEDGLDSPKPIEYQVAGQDLNSGCNDNLDSVCKDMGVASSIPIWVQKEVDSNSNSGISEFDPEIISSFRKSLEELAPDNPFYLRPLNSEDSSIIKSNIKASDVVDKKSEDSVNYKLSHCAKEKLVLYFTSLRGVRKTYEDCCHVRVILKGLGIRVDERDVSMHSGFKDELKDLLADLYVGVGLPRVFIGRKYIGGAEEIRRMHEDGQLQKLLENCEMVDDAADGGCGKACGACGDIRFMPCETCSGSCKIYYGSDEDGESEESDEYGFQRCPDCNENGLIRCPICCY